MKLRSYVALLGLSMLAIVMVPSAQAASLLINDSVEGQITLKHGPPGRLA